MIERVIRNYNDLHRAFRDRVQELRISRELLDEIGGFPRGYAGKLLGAAQTRRIGSRTLGPLCSATGSMLLLVEDSEQIARLNGRLVPRNEWAVRHRNGGAQ
jgi:hypothetical protein